MAYQPRLQQLLITKATRFVHFQSGQASRPAKKSWLCGRRFSTEDTSQNLTRWSCEQLATSCPSRDTDRLSTGKWPCEPSTPMHLLGSTLATLRNNHNFTVMFLSSMGSELTSNERVVIFDIRQFPKRTIEEADSKKIKCTHAEQWWFS